MNADAVEDYGITRGLKLDAFQIEACSAILNGDSVLVAAPTGSGKTAIADFAAFINKDQNTRLIYTTPLKALSNQKYNEFCELYGEKNVGLATGDRSIRPNAKISVMTTEVLRNIIYVDIDSLSNVSHVVLDEVHYISDRSRGAVWEEIIIQLPLEIDLICLSATVSNAEEVAKWLTTVRGSTKAIIHETRSVPLSYWFAFRKRRQSMHVMPLLNKFNKGEVAINPDLYRAMKATPRHRHDNSFLSPRRIELIEYLQESEMLPAIFFIFSRAACDDALLECFNTHIRLTGHDEMLAIREICNRHLSGLSNDEFDALDYDIVTNAMERGFAPHHAGLIPPLREAVEEAFVRNLIKVVFATETLAVGVNMPARSVVIEKLTKFNGESHEVLSPGEFTQLTGRAGRRGIDKVGHAIVQWNRFIDFEQAGALASTRSYALKSSFRPTYNMATNLINSYSPSHARHILNLSFAQFQADFAVVELERNLEIKQARLGAIRNKFKQTDKQFATMVHKRELTSNKNLRKDLGNADQISFVQSLHLGDVLSGFKYLDPCVVISKSNPRSDIRINVITSKGKIQNLSLGQIDKSVHLIGRINISKSVSKRSKHFRNDMIIELNNLLNNLPKSKVEKFSKQNKKQSETDLLDEYIDLQKSLKKLTRRVHSRGQSIARQFERILVLLEDYGYTDEWALTDKGLVLSKINADADLPLAEFIFNNQLEDLNPNELAAFISTLIFDSRTDEKVRLNKFPSDVLEKLCSECEKFIDVLNHVEREAGIKETRQMDYSMLYACYKWAQGTNLNKILENYEIAGGDFVRAMKSIVDLIRQIEKSTTNEKLIELCTKTHKRIFRDIIEVSS
ncbi:MAG: DEAD/DEAH box helicase [Acidimicrobiia bacterium]